MHAIVAATSAPLLNRRSADDERSAVCQVDFVDEMKVARVLKKLPTEDAAVQAADTFAAFADPTRLRLLHALTQAELCVCDLARVVGRSMAATSRQLQTLRRLGLVRYRSAGKLAYYSLASDWAEAMVRQAFAHRSRQAASR